MQVVNFLKTAQGAAAAAAVVGGAAVLYNDKISKIANRLLGYGALKHDKAAEGAVQTRSRQYRAAAVALIASAATFAAVHSGAAARVVAAGRGVIGR